MKLVKTIAIEQLTTNTTASVFVPRFSKPDLISKNITIIHKRGICHPDNLWLSHRMYFPTTCWKWISLWLLT